MKLMRREISNTGAQPRSSSGLYLGSALGFSLLMALLGAIYDQRAVWAAGLLCFCLVCVQVVAGYCLSRERRVVAVRIAIKGAPLSTSTL